MNSDKDLLIKGLLVAIIGVVVLGGPYIARSDAVRDLLLKSTVVGWFALVLGLAFIARWALLRRKG